MRTSPPPAVRHDTPQNEDASLPRPLQELADSAARLLERVELDPSELTGMVDALGAMVRGRRKGLQMALAEPAYAVVPTDEDRWLVVRLRQDEQHVIANLVCKDTASTLARRAARRDAGSLVLHRSDGSVQSTYHYDEHALRSLDDPHAERLADILPFPAPR